MRDVLCYMMTEMNLAQIYRWCESRDTHHYDRWTLWLPLFISDTHCTFTNIPTAILVFITAIIVIPPAANMKTETEREIQYEAQL